MQEKLNYRLGYPRYKIIETQDGLIIYKIHLKEETQAAAILAGISFVLLIAVISWAIWKEKFSEK